MLQRAQQQPVLIALVAGTAAAAHEQLSDAEAVDHLLQALRRVFPGAGSLPSPTATAVTRWASDPFSWGSYSFMAVGSHGGDRAALATPERAVAAPVPSGGGKGGGGGEGAAVARAAPVLFAGEATDPFHPATAHGAFLSGCRAAAEAVLFTQQAGECSPASPRQAVAGALSRLVSVAWS